MKDDSIPATGRVGAFSGSERGAALLQSAPRGVGIGAFLARHGVLILLTLTYATSYMDRQILSILQEPIRRDLHLSDSQLGLLTGFSFALFYAVLGIPIGRLVDGWVRRHILVISMLCWSVLTAATSLAPSFAFMLLARIGVAVGEAGVTPAGVSLIADRYTVNQRASAIALFVGVGGPLGGLIGFVWGGICAPALGWRTTFLLAGLPGLALSLILLAFVREVARPPATHRPMNFRAGVVHLAGYKTLRHLAWALALGMISTHAAWSWMASYMIRHLGMPVAQVGVDLGVLFGVGGAIGNLSIGLISDRLGTRNIRWYLWLPAIISAASVPFICLALAAHTGSGVLFCMILPCTFGAAFGSLTMSVLHMLTPERFRGTATALYILLTMLFGFGIGTWLIGIVSDLLTPQLGAASLKYALLCIVPAAAIVAAIQYVRAASALLSDAERARGA
jgi:predicted MFS family arabinose efflux permease